MTTTASRRGWLDKKPSSGRHGSWQRRWVVLEQSAAGAKISWYGDQPKPGHDVLVKGSFQLVQGTSVTEATEGFVITSPQGKKETLPLRHSLAEHQKMWVQSIREAVEGKLQPGPEDEAALNMAMKNMTANANEARERSATAADKAKTVKCLKSHGFLGLTVSNSAHGAGVVVAGLEEGSQLKACGLNVGDTIMAIGKTMVKDHASTIAAIDGTGNDEELVLTLAFPTHVVRCDKSRGDVGVSIANMPSGTGVSVCGLTDDSLALKAGLVINDEILSINGTAVNAHPDAIAIIDKSERFVDFVVVGEDHTTHDVRSVSIEKPAAAADGSWSGLTCERAGGSVSVKVTAVEDGSPAAKAGIGVGTVIYAVNNLPVRATCHARHAHGSQHSCRRHGRRPRPLPVPLPSCSHRWTRKIRSVLRWHCTRRPAGRIS